MTKITQVFELDERKAWSAVGLSVFVATFITYLSAVSPWFCLPFLWAIGGAAWVGVSLGLTQNARIWSFELACMILH